MADVKKRPIHITPAGTALYPKLGEPDTKFKAEGTYSVKLRLNGADADELIAICDAATEEAYTDAIAEAKNERDKKKIKRADPSYTPEEDEDGNETGCMLFNFKMVASGISKKDNKPWTRVCPVFDAKRKPIDPKKIKIGSGSIVKVAYDAMPFYTAALGAGCSLRLEAVQVLELHEWGNKDAASFGFGEEDGYDTVETTAGDDGTFAASEDGAENGGSEQSEGAANADF